MTRRTRPPSRRRPSQGQRLNPSDLARALEVNAGLQPRYVEVHYYGREEPLQVAPGDVSRINWPMVSKLVVVYPVGSRGWVPSEPGHAASRHRFVVRGQNEQQRK